MLATLLHDPAAARVDLHEKCPDDLQEFESPSVPFLAPFTQVVLPDGPVCQPLQLLVGVLRLLDPQLLGCSCCWLAELVSGLAFT
jgi:hypothetical protein